MKEAELYTYVGPKDIFERVSAEYSGIRIESEGDVISWMKNTKQEIFNHTVIVTFVISQNKELLISDRHSEHVMCANGEKVLSSGEITFTLDGNTIFISGISNQSTGYCPKPSSWSIVRDVLDKMNMEHPQNFTNSYEFRYCMVCESINLIKEELFECAVCNSNLDLVWNLDN